MGSEGKFKPGKWSYVLLMLVFAALGVTGYFVVRDAVRQSVERQAVVFAEMVGQQAMMARSVYAANVVDKLRKDGFGADTDSHDKPGFVPIPAQFLKLLGRASHEANQGLFRYQPISRWNLEPSQGLSDEFLRWAWPQLEAQDQVAPSGPIAWRPIYRFEQQGGKRVLRFLKADPAAQASCVGCHNLLERQLPPAVQARNAPAPGANGSVPPVKQWQLHQLMGALSITIDLDDAERVSGLQIQRATIFVVCILLGSFLAMLWFTWHLAGRERVLARTEMQLVVTERDAQSAHELLQAKQGVEEALAELSTYLRAIDQHALVSVTDRNGVIEHVNEKFCEVSGYTLVELLGRDHGVISSRIHPPEFFADLYEHLLAGKTWQRAVCNRRKDGQLFWLDMAVVPLRNAAGEIVRFISISIDITERRVAEENAIHMATHDPLTGLPNRVLLHDRTQQALAHARRTETLLAVLFLDLDGFKPINDTWGHDVGDVLLVEVAKRLLGSVRAEDTVARLGGDEFVLVLSDLAGRDGIARYAEKMVQALSEPYRVRGHVLKVGASVGIALFPEHSSSAAELQQMADKAMYAVKAGKRNTWAFYSPEMSEPPRSRDERAG